MGWKKQVDIYSFIKSKNMLFPFHKSKFEMADDAGDDTGDLKLPPKFISVHPLAAKKGSHYTCVICGSDGTFLCKLCRSCYCCREHLLLDDLACHAVLCERQAAIIEIK